MSADKRQLEQYYAFLAGHIDEVRRMQHDILHHLRVMSGYAQAGDYDRLKEDLDALVEQMPDMDGLYYCGDHAANILLKYYGEQARNGGIRFNCDAQIPPDLHSRGFVHGAGQCHAERRGGMPTPGPWSRTVYLAAGPPGRA